MTPLRNALLEISFPTHPTENGLWAYTLTGAKNSIEVAPPHFEIGGLKQALLPCQWEELAVPVLLRNGVTEYRIGGTVAGNEGLVLEIVFRIGATSPIVRFHYVLREVGGRGLALTKSTGRDAICYASFDLNAYPQRREIRLSSYSQFVHSYLPEEIPVERRHFEHEAAVMGPIFISRGEEVTWLVAYEHGSTAPDTYLQFQMRRDETVDLVAVKGNYAAGRRLSDHPFVSVWFELGAVFGDEDALAEIYRQFILRFQSANSASRYPYVFYNTWNFQERNQHWYQKNYHADMNAERMLAEIEVAHAIGIEVFVIDTGWFIKSGDWEVNEERFPQGLRDIREQLSAYGMKLGLWFNPIAAGVNSQMLRNHRDCVISWHGEVPEPEAIWLSEVSHTLCLVSRYADAFADKLIELIRDLGVTYFKWDAIGQYGCDDPGHHHGSDENSPEERADCYAFEQVRAMSRVVDKVCAACPEAIVDFDVTEPDRSVGLAFLAAGKFFLINNGPYFGNYDLEAGRGGNQNLFFEPGQARTWIGRAPLAFDKWIPSVLFLVHFLPDDTIEKTFFAMPHGYPDSQEVNLASLILGGNGIWGDLLGISAQGIRFFASGLEKYRHVRDAITQASPVRTGLLGAYPEVHEKIASDGRGCVVIFSSGKGTTEYITTHAVASVWHVVGNGKVRIGHDGRAVVRTDFQKPGATIVFFGVGDE